MPAHADPPAAGSVLGQVRNFIVPVLISEPWGSGRAISGEGLSAHDA
jgi:hypothetical protein